MSNSNNTIANNANEVSKSLTLNAANVVSKSVHHLETRDSWSVIENHCIALIALSVKGEALPQDPRKGFAFGLADGKKADSAPHCRDYARALLAGFFSAKAEKVFKQAEIPSQYEVLKTAQSRKSIATAIVGACKLAKPDRVGTSLDEVKGKRGKFLAEKLLSELGISASSTESAKPNASASKSKRRSATTEGGKAETKKRTTKGGKSNGKNASK